MGIQIRNIPTTLSELDGTEWLVGQTAAGGVLSTIKIPTSALGAGAKPQTAYTADTTLFEDDLDPLLTNFGAVGTVTLTLPVASVGLVVSASRQAPYAFRLKPAAGGYILGGLVDGYIELTSFGDVVLFCYVAGTWTVVNSSALYLMQA